MALNQDIGLRIRKPVISHQVSVSAFQSTDTINYNQFAIDLHIIIMSKTCLWVGVRVGVRVRVRVRVRVAFLELELEFELHFRVRVRVRVAF